jgi:hypothetical protein
MSLFDDGIVCELHCQYWSAEVQLKPRDLGLDPAKVSKAFSLGRKDLIPDEVMVKFRSNESAARALMDKNSFQFRLGRSARFLTYAKIDETIIPIEDLIEERKQLVRDLVANYETYKEQMRPIYIEAAEKAFDNLKAGGVLEFSIEGLEAEKQAFINTYLEQINRLYPTAESLLDKFKMWIEVWPSIEIAKTSIQVAGNTSAEALRNQVDASTAQMRNDLAEQAEEKVKRTVDIERYKAETTDRIRRYTDDVVAALRQQTRDLCDEVAENIRSGQVVTGRTYNRIKNFMEHFKKMNFVGDKAVEEQLDNFKKEFLDVFPTEQVREDTELQTELSNRLVAISRRATELSDVSEITGQYVRKVAFKRGNGNGGNNGSDPSNN